MALFRGERFCADAGALGSGAEVSDFSVTRHDDGAVTAGFGRGGSFVYVSRESIIFGTRGSAGECTGAFRELRCA